MKFFLGILVFALIGFLAVKAPPPEGQPPPQEKPEGHYPSQPPQQPQPPNQLPPSNPPSNFPFPWQPPSPPDQDEIGCYFNSFACITNYYSNMQCCTARVIDCCDQDHINFNFEICLAHQCGGMG